MKVMHRYDSEDRQHFILEQQYSFKLKPRLLYSGVLSKQKGWSDISHSHKFVEIMLVSSGKGSIIVNAKKYRIKKGDIIIYNAGLVHSEKSSFEDPLEILFIGFDKVEITELPKNFLLPPEYEFLYETGDLFEVFQQFFSIIIDETARKESFFAEISQNASRTLLMYLFRLVNRTHITPNILNTNDVFIRVTDYIDKNYLNPISLSAIANACFVSKFYISHLFSKYMSIPVAKYIQNKRFNYAKNLLLTTSLSISKVAEASGFSDQSYFSRMFKKEVGISPLKYRRE